MRKSNKMQDLWACKIAMAIATPDIANRVTWQKKKSFTFVPANQAYFSYFIWQ